MRGGDEGRMGGVVGLGKGGGGFGWVEVGVMELLRVKEVLVVGGEKVGVVLVK